MTFDSLTNYISYNKKTYIMKKLLLITFSIITFNLLSQSIWTTADDISKIQESPEFTSVVKEIGSNFITKQAFPSSKNPELLSVYEISCDDCDEVTLYTMMHRVPGLKRIEYSPKYETLELPNDYSIVVSNNWALNLIGAESAWSYTHGDTSITLAISDQNYYKNHEDLIGKIKYYDVNNTSTRTHGTAVANIAAGNTNNSVGMSSIGYNSTLALYRMNYNDVLKASYDGYKVVNMSWSSGCSYNYYAELALQEAYNNGTFLVASAGNGTTCGGANNLVYPASYNNVFSVTSIGSNDSHTSSNGSTHQHNSLVDICAPGYNVPITAAPGWYLTNSGSSFAAPFVTGTIGLMLSVNPKLTNNQIDSILRLTAVNIYSINPQYVGLLGAGRLNSGDAVRIAYEMTIVVDNDHDNGHGNNEGGFDTSNPGYDNSQLGSQNGVINNNSNNGNGQGNNGNHFQTLSDNNLSIYPNPSTGIFIVTGLVENSSLLDNSGRLVMKLNSTDFITIQIEIPGIYYLVTKNENKKIVIQ